MKIQHRQSEASGEFVVEQDGQVVAEMTYSRQGQTITIRHTEVSPSLGGQGVGRQLVAASVDWARREHVKVNPVCSFARAVFDKTPDYADVRAAL